MLYMYSFAMNIATFLELQFDYYAISNFQLRPLCSYIFSGGIIFCHF